jgi:hypothetical protein
MVRRLTAIAAGVGAMLVGSVAHAQMKSAFGDKGEYIFSADRLLPTLGYSRVSQDETGPLGPGITKVTDSESSSSLGLFWGGSPGYVTAVGGPAVGNTAVGGSSLPNVYTVPRLGFDYTILPNVTVGGDMVLFFTLGGTQSQETDNNAGGKATMSVSAPKSTIFGMAPRGGYILRFTNLVSLWLRGGFSFYTATVRQTVSNDNVQTTTSANVDQLALDLDPQLVITPIPHFGFTSGLTADLPLTGGHSLTTTTPNTSASASASSSLLFVGITCGVIGWF